MKVTTGVYRVLLRQGLNKLPGGARKRSGKVFKRYESKSLATGILTTIGGLVHDLPCLIPDFWIATYVAIAIVFVELWIITWIQNKFMETPWSRAIFQVVLGGALVFAAGVLIGTG